MSNTPTVDMTPEIRLAIEAGIKDALKNLEKAAGDARDAAKPDQTLKEVSVHLRLDIAEVSIGHDTDKSPTTSIPLLPTLALMVKRLGVDRDAALKTLKEVMEEALTLDRDATDALLKEAGVAEAEEAIKTKVISTLPRTPVKKSIKTKGATILVTGITQKA